MNKNKLKIFYIISVFVLLLFFSNCSFDIGKPSFFVPVIIVSLLIGIIGVYLFGNDMRLYKNLYFISYVLTLGIAFVPVIGLYTEDGIVSYGFPSQWLYYYHLRGSVSFNLLGFLFNFFIFYLILQLLCKASLKFAKNETNFKKI